MKRRIIILTIVSALAYGAQSNFLSELTSNNGLDIGNGLNLKVGHSNEIKPVMDRLFLDLSYGGVGVSARKAKDNENISLDFYVKDNNSVFEGRGKQNKHGGMGNKLIGMVVAFKSALVGAFVFVIMKLLILKAIVLAKVSLIISLVLLVMKLKSKHSPDLVEIEQHGPYSYSHPGLYSERHPGYGGYGGYSNAGADGRLEAAPSNNAYDVVYAPTGVAENAALYANVAVANHTLLQPLHGNERKYTVDRKRRKLPSTLVTVKQ